MERQAILKSIDRVKAQEKKLKKIIQTNATLPADHPFFTKIILKEQKIEGLTPPKI